MEPTSTSSSWDRAQKLFNKNIELETKRQKSLKARVPSDPNTWHQIRENYEAIILEDHAFSEKHNIEFLLWQLHYKRIEEFRTHFSTAQASARSSATKNSRAPLQPDRVTKVRVQFKAFLSEATGFYHDLILKIRAKYGLPLGHFSDTSENMAIMGNDTDKSSDVKKALVSCHRCLIYLGDLVRYKGLYGEGESRAREYSAASSYYLQAASMWPSNGNSHHQLAILANYAGDELVAVYRYFRSLAVEVPFPTAKDNLVIAFEKNRQSYTQQLETTKNAVKGEVSIKEKYKDFCNGFIRLQGILYSRISLETFSDVLSSVKEVLHELLSSGLEENYNFGGDGFDHGLFILRLTAILIFSVYNVNKKTEGQTYAQILQHNVLYENACTVTFELMDLIIERCLELHDLSSSSFLPGILVFLEWLVCYPDVATCAINEKKITAVKMSFWKHSIALFNKLLSSRMVLVDDDGDEMDRQLALAEDFELRGFLPLLPAQNSREFSRKQSLEKRTRVKRIISAGKSLTSVAMVDQKAVSFNLETKQFIIGTPRQMPEKSNNSSFTEQEIAKPSVNSTMVLENTRPLFETDEDDEEIVFKPVFVEKQMDVIVTPTQNPPVTDARFHQISSQFNMPSSESISMQVHPETNLPNSAYQQVSVVDGIKELRFVENGLLPSSNLKGSLDVQNTGSFYPPQPTYQQVSVVDDIKELRFVENGLLPPSNLKGSLDVQNTGSFYPPQPFVSGIMDNAMYSDYKRASEFFIPSNMNSAAFPEVVAKNDVIKEATMPTTFKSQGSRPVRHLGPPPGFTNVPPKFNMPVSNFGGINGSMSVDDYRWLDGFQMPRYGTNQVSFGANPVASRGGSLPFSRTQSSRVQFQGGNLKPYSEYPSFQNVHPNPGQKLPEQTHIMPGNQLNSIQNVYPNPGQKLPEQHHIMPGNQFSSQAEHNQGPPTWSGQYRV